MIQVNPGVGVPDYYQFAELLNQLHLLRQLIHTEITWLIVGLAGCALTICIVIGNLTDELRKANASREERK